MKKISMSRKKGIGRQISLSVAQADSIHRLAYGLRGLPRHPDIVKVIEMIGSKGATIKFSEQKSVIIGLLESASKRLPEKFRPSVRSVVDLVRDGKFDPTEAEIARVTRNAETRRKILAGEVIE